jgi:hypothetical protein
MALRGFIYAAWIAGTGLQLVLAVVLVSKRMWRQFPIFTTYSLICFLQSVVGFGIRGFPKLYVYVYCPFEIVSSLLGLGVIYEVFTKLLSAYPALREVAFRAFQWTVVALISVSMAVVYFHAPVEGSRFVSLYVVLEQATRIAEVGLLLFLFSFSRVFGLHWRQSIFGIALGLGFFATVELMGITLRAVLGITATPMFNAARAVSFTCSLLIWIGYILAPERVTSTGEIPKRAQLEQWNQAMMELINQ